MQKQVAFIIPYAALLTFMFCDGSNDPAECAEAPINAAIQRIGYHTTDSILSICFINSLSFCPPELPYRINRLDISLTDFSCTCSSTTTEAPEVLPLPQGSRVLFDGEILCYDSCRIPVPIALPDISIEYVNVQTDILLEIDTNGTEAGTFGIGDPMKLD